jgi:hypothetical protein
LCNARSATLQYPDFFFGLLLPAFEKAIAAACRFGLPSRRNFAMFAETVFEDLPGFNGMSSLQLVERFAGAFDQVFAARQERVDDVPDSDVANPFPDRITGFDDGVEYFDNRLPIADDNRSTESPHTFASLLSGHGYLLGVLVDVARLPARFAKSASCTCRFEGRVDGVFFFETTFDGRQYWLLASPE